MRPVIEDTGRLGDDACLTARGERGAKPSDREEERSRRDPDEPDERRRPAEEGDLLARGYDRKASGCPVPDAADAAASRPAASLIR